ncbi:hypothetical protein MCOR07_006276 [Pyricularia oryzae]|uniref:Amidase domain-containing protein n=1 Tax=Pyricularia grisea TaxID=148305 RepID=A0ABQ8N6F4_PYRGI|nr:hypothetical protein MCOR26_005293 [Pyricularia oryzae]KAI6292076.1 hypothetical protein MCOR33_010134 [Pyricularia grisea]KAI6293470.1 hypothetical protein MCOR34_009863 [Pyricularia oryzae]KAI6313506.1 hypothetical protein MCOR30_010278 [Pyricularia oryzae]KAI6317417.1 hypothetical protein MCOR29_006313 [Pyricularia oryzae]
MSNSNAAGVVLTIHGDDYYFETSSSPLAQIPPDSSCDGDFSLAALWNFHDEYFSIRELFEVKMQLEESDENVWDPAFSDTIILRAARQVQLASDIKSHRVLSVVDDAKNQTQGPCVIQNRTGKVLQAFKLQRDTQKAFVGGVMRVDNPPASVTYRWHTSSDRIPVPYSQPVTSEELLNKPLSGLRFAIKDTIDVAGLETRCGSSAWANTYPARTETAEFVTQLVEAGALFVGKLRCDQLCDAQDPLERSEEEVPWNPRGDGFQKPSGTSSGSAAACAAYPWLDFTIGGDTGGSIRHPAAVNGVYGLRTSLGSVRSRGIVACARMDTVGPLARSAEVLAKVARVMISSQESPLPTEATAEPNPRFRLVVLTDSYHTAAEGVRFFPPEDFPDVPNKAALAVFSEVLRRVEQMSGEARWHVNPHEVWRKTHPAGMADDLAKATRDIYPRLVYADLWRDVVSPLHRDHRARHGGEAAHLEPLLKARVEFAAGVTQAEYDETAADFDRFRDWVNEELLPSPAQNGGEIPLVVFPQSWGLPQYRDDAVPTRTRPEDLFFRNAFSAYSLSYCSGCPDATVPVGQVQVRSRVTETEVGLPVALSFLAPKGADLQLAALLKMFEESGVFKAVSCGRNLYP